MRKKKFCIACGYIPIKIHFSEYSKSLISRIMKFMHFSIKYRYSDSDIVLKKHKLHLLQSHSLLCWHSFCDVDNLNPSSMYTKGNFNCLLIVVYMRVTCVIFLLRDWPHTDVYIASLIGLIKRSYIQLAHGRGLCQRKHDSMFAHYLRTCTVKMGDILDLYQ